MVMHPTSIEVGTTPETGVFFYEALEHLNPFTLQLIENYPQIVAESEAVRGLVDTSPHLHEEYEDVDDATVIDQYMSNSKKIVEDGATKDARLLEEMGWRHRLREEAARAVDAGDAIRRGVYAGSVLRMFDGSESVPQSSSFIPTLLGMMKGQADNIGEGLYGPITLQTRQGGDRTFFARFSEQGTVIFGLSLTVKPEELAGIREANADDCCQLVNDLVSTRSEKS